EVLEDVDEWWLDAQILVQGLQQVHHDEEGRRHGKADADEGEELADQVPIDDQRRVARGGREALAPPGAAAWHPLPHDVDDAPEVTQVRRTPLPPRDAHQT